jgi:hypothetical protein
MQIEVAECRGKIQLTYPGELCSIDSPGGLGLNPRNYKEKNSISIPTESSDKILQAFK